VTASLASHFVVTDDEMHVIASRLGVQSLPVVLGLRPRHATETDLYAAVDYATRSLSARGLISDGEIAADIVPLIGALQRPERELAMRLVTPDGIARVAVIRHGVQCISVLRVDGKVVIESTEGPPTMAQAAGALLRRLPASPAADIDPVGAPLDAVVDALSDTHDSALLSDRIRALGADARTAMLHGSALASRQAFAEIVYYALDGDEGRISRHPIAVGVFYTKRGRIVAAPSASPSGQLWTTLKAGSDHAIRHAIGHLVELSAERWEEP
jgi:EspG family